jgi:sugar O-acyltransferase (sialic acid O-acetyltransferase NeuD family)
MAMADAAHMTSAGRSVRPLVVVGGGEHGRVVVEAARSRPGSWQVIGYADPDPEARLARLMPDLESIGGDDRLRVWLERRTDRPALVLGIGGRTRPADRSVLVAGLAGAGVEWAIVVHAAAIVSPSATLSPGAFVAAHAVVNSGAVVGAHTIVNTSAIVEHDVAIGDHCHVGPGAAIGGGTTVGRGVFVGIGASVRDHISVGDGATIAMGAVVIDDVPPGATVSGLPARIVSPA